MKGKWHIIVVCALFSIWNKAHWLWFGFVLFSCLFLWFIKRKAPLSFLLLFAFTFLWFSFLPSQPSSFLSDSTFIGRSQTVQGKIVQHPEVSETKMEFVLKEKVTKEKIYVTINTEDVALYVKQFQHGAFCEIKGTPRLPQVAGNPGNFDYRAYLNSKGIYLQLNADLSNTFCKGESILATPYAIKDTFLSYLSSTYSKDTIQWIQALLFGNKDYLSKDVIEQFQYWNLSHILAISGLHVGLIIGLLYFFLTKILGLTKEKGKIILIIILPIYALFAGSQPPVLRAVVMAEILFLTSFFQKKWPITDVISITALCFIFLDPKLIEQMSFQFSFLVTYALVLSKNILIQQRSYFWNSVYISFISQLVLLPLQLSAFYYVSPLSLFSNLLFVPYFSVVVIPICLIATILSWLPSFPIIINPIFSFHQDLISFSIQLLDSLQFIWVIGKISFPIFVLYFVMYFLFMKKLEQKQLVKAFLYGIILVMLLITEQLKPYLNPYGTITMLDVGQGDTIVVELPYRKAVLLIDAAKENHFSEGELSNENNTAKYQIQPFLWSKGIKTIDHIVITHEDVDHMGSLDYVMEHFQVGSVYVSPYVDMKIDKEKKQTLTAGDMLQIDEYKLYVLHPDNQADNKNDNSIVLLGTFGGATFLFTGDISSKIEEEIVRKYKPPVDVLKVAHHGSKHSTSQAFLKEISPEVALISAGKFNLYGHPSTETIERLKEEKVHVFRTDLNGAITYKFNHNHGTFYPWIPYDTVGK